MIIFFLLISKYFEAGVTSATIFRDFKVVYNDYYGKCFTFNHGSSGEVNKTSKYGSRYGMCTIFVSRLREQGVPLTTLGCMCIRNNEPAVMGSHGVTISRVIFYFKVI